MSDPKHEPLWSIDRVSAYLGIPKWTLYGWRKSKYGPPASRMGRHLRYDPADVIAWKEQQKDPVEKAPQ
ncbi:helix-turn-helix transcriptional regulator [Kribbella italica]|uniref:Putative DNA-binding transcriptional regulator AlpA n=1 Tax=Kribbella italica TaxID=1540520 RepID=A0A7W9J0C4_9ACTN|nr:helix-turn-helix domain-containing protein [Kribbella italica]MBB5833288.1 putative DNA-binding transcriptional regulator AlpA [Kribbella italica]